MLNSWELRWHLGVRMAQSPREVNAQSYEDSLREHSWCAQDFIISFLVHNLETLHYFLFAFVSPFPFPPEALLLRCDYDFRWDSACILSFLIYISIALNCSVLWRWVFPTPPSLPLFRQQKMYYRVPTQQVPFLVLIMGCKTLHPVSKNRGAGAHPWSIPQWSSMGLLQQCGNQLSLFVDLISFIPRKDDSRNRFKAVTWWILIKKKTNLYFFQTSKLLLSGGIPLSWGK